MGSMYQIRIWINRHDPTDRWFPSVIIAPPNSHRRSPMTLFGRTPRERAQWLGRNDLGFLPHSTTGARQYRPTLLTAMMNGHHAWANSEQVKKREEYLQSLTRLIPPLVEIITKYIGTFYI